MFKKSAIHIILLVLLVLPSYFLNAQGFQTQFGKSKVQFKQFEWTFYRDKEFEVYYHQNGRNLAQYLISHVLSIY